MSKAGHTSALSRSGPLKWLGHVGAWVYVVFLIAPLYYLLISAFKSNKDIFNYPFSPFTPLQTDNFSDALSQAQLLHGIMNSVLVTAGAEVLTIVLAVPAAYALARSKGRLGMAIERVFSLGFLIPGFAALVPTVLLSITIGLFHTMAFLVVFFPATVMPLTVILLVQAMRAIPADLEESAMLDGASRFQIMARIYLPLTIPTLATVSILNFLTFWNEYFFSLVIAGTDVGVRTAQVALPTLSTATNTQYGVLSAGVLITLIPVYLVYASSAKRMEGAVLAGAIKG